MRIRKLIYLVLVLFFSGGIAIAQKKHEVLYFGNDKSIVYDIEFIGSTKLAVADGKSIKIYNNKDQKLLNELKDGHQDVILSIDVSSDSSKLISAGRDGVICLWDINKGGLLSRHSYHKGVVTKVKFSPDNKFILSGGIDKKVILYDIINSNEKVKYLGHTDHILSVDFHPTGNYIASSGADKQLILWHTRSDERIATFDNLKGWQRDISFSYDSTKLISCGDDANLNIWDISNLKNIRLLNQIKVGRGWLLTQNLNTDGTTFLSGGMERKIRITFRFGKYIFNAKKPITKVLFKPNSGSNLSVIASTIGGGVFLVDAKNMKSLSF